MTENQRKGRAAVREYAASKGLAERGEEYIAEAEHGDGDAYWDLFVPFSIEAVQEDFDLYNATYISLLDKLFTPGQPQQKGDEEDEAE